MVLRARMHTEQIGPRREKVRLPVWMDVLFQGIIDLAQSKRVSMPVRILCTCLISLVFLIGITGLFLLVFIIEGQSLLRRGIFLLMGLAILAYYLHFLSILVRKDGKKP